MSMRDAGTADISRNRDPVQPPDMTPPGYAWLNGRPANVPAFPWDDAWLLFGRAELQGEDVACNPLGKLRRKA